MLLNSTSAYSEDDSQSVCQGLPKLVQGGEQRRNQFTPNTRYSLSCNKDNIPSDIYFKWLNMLDCFALSHSIRGPESLMIKSEQRYDTKVIIKDVHLKQKTRAKHF